MYRIRTLVSYDLSDQHADKGRKYSRGGGGGGGYSHIYSFQAVYI